MAPTPLSSSNFRLILDAFDDYAKHTGVDLMKDPFATKIQDCRSSDAILGLLTEKANEFKDYRDGNRKLINWLSPVVTVVNAFSGIIGDAISLTPFQPAKAIFSGVSVLLAAASGVSTSYDALVDLFECIGNFLKRLHIYTEIPFTSAMVDVIVKIMVEVLSVLALATKQIKQGRFKKFAKKLLGENDIEAVLTRLDRLTQEEARMTVAQTLQVVHGLMSNMKVVMDDGKASTDGIRQALITMQDTANDINKMKRDQLQEKIRHWLSPPDPSKNHNIARKAHHGGTATWFTSGTAFLEWKTTGSLLWIHGKPGSGKSILCSTIVQEAKSLRDAGLALMAYFYFDFRDTTKQDLRGLLSSVLAQLCAKSDTCYEILSNLYSTHDSGSQQPDDIALTECLKSVVDLAGQPAIYIIIDALDECPNTSGMESAREQVLGFVEELVDLRLSHVHICVTSRPETDIIDVLQSLSSHVISLHDESGQKGDIIDYLGSIVQADRKMRRWRVEDRELVIDTLSQRADGMFKWIVCQLETLRRTFPAAIRRTLEELPQTLDETYERTLLGIDKEKSEYAHRLFQCLTVSVRPLRVEELAEVLAVQFDAEQVPHYHPDWRPEDAKDAVLSACSSLITVVNVDGSPVVQFSHFSVKEFLTSNRLATAIEDLSRYHVDLQSGHIVLAKACISILLELDDKVDKEKMKNFPLANYAARHWVDHGQFGNVSSGIQHLMECLFDRSKPHFATWVWIYDIDRPWPWVNHMSSMHPIVPEAVPLYYATLCGFPGLIDHLAITCPEDVNATGGYHRTPLHAAFAKGHIDVALRLIEHGADLNAFDGDDITPLYRAARGGRVDVAKLLLEHHADANMPNIQGQTPLALASTLGEIEVTQLLIRHGADVNIPDSKLITPLDSASQYGHVDVVRLLLEKGATIDPRDHEGWTPLQTASHYGHLDVVRELLDRGAAINTRNNKQDTPLAEASAAGNLEIARLLIDRGANIDSLDAEGCTPFHDASRNGHLDIMKLLIERSHVDVNIRNNEEETPLDLASGNGELEAVRFLIESGANVISQDVRGWTPLHTASRNGHLNVVKFFIQNGVDVDIRNGAKETPLDVSVYQGHVEVPRFLIENGADVNTRDENGWTPLHTATNTGHLDAVKLLVEKGADASIQSNSEETPLDLAYKGGAPEIIDFLASYTANTHSTASKMGLQNSHSNLAEPSPSGQARAGSKSPLPEADASLHSASMAGDVGIVQLLLDGGEDVNQRNGKNETPLDLASIEGRLEVAKLLLARGADLNCRDDAGWTPMHSVSRYGHLEVAQLLIDHGADVNLRSQNLWTPLHLASCNGHLELVELLLKQGALINVLNDDGWTPSREALAKGYHRIVKLLLEYSRRGI